MTSQTSTMPAVKRNETPAPIPSTASPVRKWLHAHPMVLKTATVGLGILGLLAAGRALPNGPYFQVAGGMLITTGALAFDRISLLFVPPTHAPSNHAFVSGECRGVFLNYEGNLPILTIPKDVKPRDAGYARGYLMAEQIRDMVSKNDFAFFTVRGLPRKIPALIERMKTTIPRKYLEEMEGIVEGYNARREDWGWPKGRLMSLDQVLYFHLMPEIQNLDFKAMEAWAAQQGPLSYGCSVVMDADPGSGPKAMRTVDWFAMDVYGTYSYIQRRETPDGRRIIGQSFPLMIGEITVMNESGLFAAINTARGITDCPDRLPAVLYVRELIEECRMVEGGEFSAEHFWENRSPFGAFNLSLLDARSALSVHFYQMPNGTHHVRRKDFDNYLSTLNFRYTVHGPVNPTPSNSIQRQAEIEKQYAAWSMKSAPNVEKRLKTLTKGDEVNNVRTIAAAYVDPKDRIFQIAFDNGYAGDMPLMDVPARDWFERKS